jgi:stress-induced morphogen
LERGIDLGRPLAFAAGVLEPDRVRELLLRAFPDAELEIEDLTGGKDHYQLRIVSARFLGVAPVARHRLVYAALGEHMKADIHALALVTLSPEEAQKL